MIEQINEKVSVVTVYDRLKGTVIPKKVRWQGRDLLITKVAYHHKLRNGKFLQHIFHVSSETIDLRLRLDTETLQWTLEEVCDGLTAQ